MRGPPLVSDPGTDRQRAIVVLGPGRCGTSTLARGLIALGIAFGDRLKPAARKNPRGFFEDIDLLRVNYEVHARLGLRRNGSSVAGIPPATWDHADLDPLAEDATRILARRFGRDAIWGCKIGGMMRVLPFWEGVFAAADLDVAYVLAIRHPASVARSRAKLDPYRAIPEKSDLEYAAQILPYAKLMQRRSWVAVDYDRVISDPVQEMCRLVARLDLPVSGHLAAEIDTYASGFVSPAYRRSEPVGPTHPLTLRLYQVLLAHARDEPEPGSLLDALADMAMEFDALDPVLRLVDTLEERLRSRGPTLRGMLLAAWSHLPTPASFTRAMEKGHAGQP